MNFTIVRIIQRLVSEYRFSTYTYLPNNDSVFATLRVFFFLFVCSGIDIICMYLSVTFVYLRQFVRPFAFRMNHTLAFTLTSWELGRDKTDGPIRRTRMKHSEKSWEIIVSGLRIVSFSWLVGRTRTCFIFILSFGLYATIVILKSHNFFDLRCHILGILCSNLLKNYFVRYIYVCIRV